MPHDTVRAGRLCELLFFDLVFSAALVLCVLRLPVDFLTRAVALRKTRVSITAAGLTLRARSCIAILIVYVVRRRSRKIGYVERVCDEVDCRREMREEADVVSLDGVGRACRTSQATKACVTFHSGSHVLVVGISRCNVAVRWDPMSFADGVDAM